MHDHDLIDEEYARAYQEARESGATVAEAKLWADEVAGWEKQRQAEILYDIYGDEDNASDADGRL